MARVFCIPLFLALFLLTMKILVAPSLAWAETADANMPLWKSIRDFEDKHAFEIYGPPLPQNAAKAQAETRLYEDMVLYFDETAEDEPDFIFVAEAFSVPVEIFRPEIIRPGEAKKIKDDPFGEDDPLPEAVQSTSAYVDEIRPTFLPGGPLKQRDPKQVVLGEEKAGSLFAESDRLKEEAKAAEKTAESKPAETAAKPPDTESILVGPAKKKEPAVGSNEETLMALKKAVHELGIERQLNFDGKNAQQAGAAQPQTEAGKQTSPAPAIDAPAASAAPAVMPADTAVTPPPVVQKDAPTPAKAKKKTRKKKRVKRTPVIESVPAPVPAETEPVPEADPANPE